MLFLKGQDPRSFIVNGIIGNTIKDATTITAKKVAISGFKLFMIGNSFKTQLTSSNSG